MRILLDQSVPRGIRRFFDEDVATARELGWSEYVNGKLIAAAEAARFDVLITADQNLRYQQNLSGRTIAFVVLTTNRWKELRQHGEQLREAVRRASPGSLQMLERPATRDAEPSADSDDG